MHAQINSVKRFRIKNANGVFLNENRQGLFLEKKKKKIITKENKIAEFDE